MDIIIYIGGILATIIGIFLAGQRKGKADVETEIENTRKATQGRITDAVINSGTSSVSWRDRLRKIK